MLVTTRNLNLPCCYLLPARVTDLGAFQHLHKTHRGRCDYLLERDDTDEVNGKPAFQVCFRNYLAISDQFAIFVQSRPKVQKYLHQGVIVHCSYLSRQSAQ